MLSWETVPYAICYVVTKNGEVAGFTTETSFEGAAVQAASNRAAGEALWQVQAVNEFGGLSKKATANAATGISEKVTVKSEEFAAAQYYTMDGRRTPQLQHGLNIVRMSDGTVKKILIK